MPSDADSSGEIPREQLETALLLLESHHGMWLRHEWSDQAAAYYEAIEIVEDALDEKWDPDPRLYGMEEDIERSRQAREEGMKAATLWDERYSNDYRTESWLSGVAARVRGFF